MILLDTNIISEALKTSGDKNVLAWMDAQMIETLYLSTISLAELRFGIAALPDGKRKDSLHSIFEKRVLPLFFGRILSFDDAALQSYANCAPKPGLAGMAVTAADGFIAGNLLHIILQLLRCDTTPFIAAGLTVINPWEWQSH
jgi:predicted nucleic acid-binding protein